MIHLTDPVVGRRRVQLIAECGETIEDVSVSMLALGNLLIDMCKRANRGVTCRIHGSHKKPTRCPVCALAECRKGKSRAQLARVTGEKETPVA